MSACCDSLQVWNEDFVLAKKEIRRMYSARTLTYSEVDVLSDTLFWRIMNENFPETKAIKKSLVWWGVFRQRKFVVLSICTTGSRTNMFLVAVQHQNDPSRRTHLGDVAAGIIDSGTNTNPAKQRNRKTWRRESRILKRKPES